MRRAVYSEDKIKGLMFGLLLGDAFGSQFNDLEPLDIPPLDLDYVRLHPPDSYTADTQMAISVLEEMVEHGAVDQNRLRERFLKRFTPWRGYGGGMLEVMERWRSNETARSVAGSLYNGTGSFGDGAAVRCSPTSAFFGLEETAELFDQVRLNALLTHTHIYGITDAIVQVTAVLFALNDMPKEQWVERLFKLSMESAFKITLGRLVQCVERKASAQECAQEIGNGSPAIEAVPAALCAFLRYPDSFADTLFFASSMGGDANTIAAMAGAISGASLGASRIPTELIKASENSAEGVDFIAGMVRRAFVEK